MSDCPFCQPDREILLTTDLSICFYDKYPVTRGHLLVVPKRHVLDYFELASTAAGQTIFHVHIHIIPGYFSDVDDLTGGERDVIPGKGKY